MGCTVLGEVEEKEEEEPDNWPELEEIIGTAPIFVPFLLFGLLLLVWTGGCLL